MKKVMGLLAVACAVVMMGVGPSLADAGAKLGTFSLKALDGSQVTQESIKGKTTLFVVAQTACGQCRRELKAINANLDKVKAKADVYVVLVDMNEESGVNRYEAAGYKMKALIDSKFTLPSQAGIDVTPGTFIVDEDLNVTYKKTGFRPGAFDSLLQKL